MAGIPDRQLSDEDGAQVSPRSGRPARPSSRAPQPVLLAPQFILTYETDGFTRNPIQGNSSINLFETGKLEGEGMGVLDITGSGTETNGKAQRGGST